MFGRKAKRIHSQMHVKRQDCIGGKNWGELRNIGSVLLVTWVGVAQSVRAGRSGDRIPVGGGRDFSHPSR